VAQHDGGATSAAQLLCAALLSICWVLELLQVLVQ
jgi:hypothetical protein